MFGLLRAATAPLQQSLAVSLSALAGSAQAVFLRYFGNGYDPDACDSTSRRGEQAIAVRNLSVCYGERRAPRRIVARVARGHDGVSSETPS
jgi:hypothetical protein